jgi:uncharacterized protein YerC
VSFSITGGAAANKEFRMDRDMAQAPRRRLTVHGMALRRKRIFAQLREGMSYEEIASDEGVSATRIRQIVSEVLQKRAIDNGADHAKLQLERLAPAMQLAAEAIAVGDVSAIAPYLKVLDRLDRYQTVVGAHEGYDDEARKNLLEKINRIAANLGVDEVMYAAAREHLKKIGAIVEDEPSETEGPEGPEAPAPQEAQEPQAASPAGDEKKWFESPVSL